MSATAKTPTLAGVTQEGGQDDGERIRERRLRLGLSVSALARHAHVDRDTINRAETGSGAPHDTTIAAIGAALSELERERGLTEPEEPTVPMPAAAPEAGRLVRFEVQGVYGADALVIEGPVENIGELEAAVDRIMRSLRGREEDT